MAIAIVTDEEPLRNGSIRPILKACQLVMRLVYKTPSAQKPWWKLWYRFGYGLMIIVLKYSRPALVGVARTIGLEQLADTLHAMGITVKLSGWQPTTTLGGAVAH